MNFIRETKVLTLRAFYEIRFAKRGAKSDADAFGRGIRFSESPRSKMIGRLGR